MSKEITYVKVKDASIATILSSSETANKQKNSLDKTEGNLWGSTVVALASVVNSQKNSKEEYYDALQNTMAKLIMSSVVLPETIKGKDGKEVPLCKKDGSVKWSSWDKTKRIWAYLSDIAKVCANGLASQLLPESDLVAARCDILALCKGTETAIEGVRRYQKGLQGCLDLLSIPAEVLEAHQLTSALVVNNLEPEDEAMALVIKLDAILSACPSASKAKILVAMDRLTKHFA